MGTRFVRGIYVVAAVKGSDVEYRAAATPRGDMARRSLPVWYVEATTWGGEVGHLRNVARWHRAVRAYPLPAPRRQRVHVCVRFDGARLRSGL